jgi:asparagine synthase (glutamine-hydrolysing)
MRELSYQQLTRSTLQMLLHWEDRDSMAHSVEARVPFLDHHLVEFVLGLPDDYKLSGGVTKRILRESLRGVLTEAIRDRMSKLGFATPEESWIRQQAPQKFREAMQQSIESSQGVLRSCEALKAFDEIVDGKRPFDFAIWRMISFARWIERFDVRVA